MPLSSPIVRRFNPAVASLLNQVPNWTAWQCDRCCATTNTNGGARPSPCSCGGKWLVTFGMATALEGVK